ncbi:protein of unknown function [Candidatus Hydrogenisulfobacillus filiaventi]|uniref:Rhodanese domain-containing protein n=1 Tax=Candidatus Hydrogenisulfobacillus filiaventi TaxID=2707344 RepID=A0A6F8ZHC2_9FIRM|nr:protein of unknown function [Candidatus Hydrogenisulfobacillus filiaventi]
MVRILMRPVSGCCWRWWPWTWRWCRGWVASRRASWPRPAWRPRCRNPPAKAGKGEGRDRPVPPLLAWGRFSRGMRAARIAAGGMIGGRDGSVPASAWSVGPGTVEVAALLAGPTPVRVVDVRTPFEFRRGHLPGAVPAPWGRTAAVLAAWDRSTPIRSSQDRSSQPGRRPPPARTRVPRCQPAGRRDGSRGTRRPAVDGRPRVMPDPGFSRLRSRGNGRRRR